MPETVLGKHSSARLTGMVAEVVHFTIYPVLRQIEGSEIQPSVPLPRDLPCLGLCLSSRQFVKLLTNFQKVP